MPVIISLRFFVIFIICSLPSAHHRSWQVNWELFAPARISLCRSSPERHLHHESFCGPCHVFHSKADTPHPCELEITDDAKSTLSLNSRDGNFWGRQNLTHTNANLNHSGAHIVFLLRSSSAICSFSKSSSSLLYIHIICPTLVDLYRLMSPAMACGSGRCV